MQKLENDSAVIPFPTNGEVAPADDGGNSGNYDAVRFNAMQHGILSRYTALSHEGVGEYQALLSALFEEHQPTGATEAHLVEKLAGIIWRKRRVLQAEGATINRGLRCLVTSEVNSTIPAAAPFV